MSFDFPPQEPRPEGVRPVSTAPRRRGALLPTLVILGALAMLFLLFVGYYTDWLWFRAVGYTSVFTTQLWVRAALFVVFFVLTAVVVGANIYLAYRFRPAFRSISLEQQSLDRYRLAIDPLRRALLIGIPAVFGFFAGVSALAEWRTFLAWRNATDFGQTDPQFGMDISFFAFDLPWWRFLVGGAMTIVVVSTLAAAATHYLYGGIRLQTEGERTSHAARAHLSVLIGVFVLLKAVAYWLDRYDLLLSTSSLFTGAGYTDINALLPAKTILAVVALISGVLFIVNVFRRTWTLAVLSLGLLAFTAIVIGGIYPGFVQRFQVQPSELSQEEPYIQRNIDSTRAAYEIDDVEAQPYTPGTTPTRREVREARGTVENVRLIDPAIVAPTFQQLQQIRGFYTFVDPLDVDRYPLGGESEGVVVAPREVNIEGLDSAQRNWINQHLVFTHGFGVVAAYGDRATADGEPDWVVGDIPPVGDIDIEQPRIYFGELTRDYSIVGALEDGQPRELDFPDDTSETGQRNNTYDGEGGVPMGSLFNRIVYAVKFQETNILLSNLINENSEVLYIRQPRERAQQVAPWLTLDADPYATVIDGEVVWIIDGYTTSNGYPYSERRLFGDITTDSRTLQSEVLVAQARDQINYIRNSVKVTVDAYDGTVTLYEWDEDDPVLQTWSKAFPGTVQPKEEISEELMGHLRYPADMFKVQRELFASYHVTDAASFYNGQDFWRVPSDPTSPTTEVPQPPYYLTLQMPGQDEPTFSLTTTFGPSNRDTLAAFMSVASDPTADDYGTIRMLQLPRNTTFPGPRQMQNQFDSDPQVQERLRLLRGGGSEVQNGNLLILPVGGALMYVEPIYVRAASQGASYPLLRRVLVSFGNAIAFESSYTAALETLLGQVDIAPPGEEPGDGEEPPPDGEPTGSAADQLVNALDAAQEAYDDGQAALRDGDFAAYGEAQDRLAAALREAERAALELGIAVPEAPDADEAVD